MAYALMASGGKDSILALDRARDAGLDVRYLVTFHDGATGRVRFHGVRHELIELQAQALGLECLSMPTLPTTFEATFLRTLRELKDLGVTGVVFGNVSLADVREWYEERVRAAGLEHVEPLWGGPAVEVAWAVVERGYRAIVVSAEVARGVAGLLGREFDADLVTEISTRDDIDPCGERGEFHTFVFDGPEFSSPVGFSMGETVELEGRRFVDLVPAGAPSTSKWD
jgi:uncharacterized protein (TIGR00290 family)